MGLGALVVSLCLSGVTPGESAAEHALAAGRSEVTQLHFERALLLAEQGIASGIALPQTLAALHALRAQVLATTGHHPDAVEAYAHALVLEPTFALPPGSSPRLRTEVDAARKRLGDATLTFAVESRMRSAQAAQTSVRVEGDVLHVADHATLVHGAEKTPFATTTPWIASWPCGAPPCPFRVEVHDLAGNVVRMLGTESAPLFVHAPAAPLGLGLRGSAPRAWYARPWPYWALAGVVAGVGTYFAVSFASEQAALAKGLGDPGVAARTLSNLDAARRRDRVGAWVGFGVAGALGGTGFVFL